MDETLTDIATLDLPYRRKATLREVRFESGMRLVRLVLREGTRITQVDLDNETAQKLGSLLIDAAQGGEPENG
uniref:Uncharacterized protein n=1 Tax=uncultured bacterium ws101A12 TaxID=1131826 RepID=I1X4G4_9BACT|nr:hypothetical protein ws101A12_0021 [uncultured bacterium ws101A12]